MRFRQPDRPSMPGPRTPARERSPGAGQSPAEGARPGLRYYLLAIFLCFLWGLGFTAIKVALWGAGPYLLAWLRALLAGLVLIPYLRLSHRGVPLFPAAWPFLLLNALFYSFFNLAIFLGTELTTASRAAVILYTQPLFVAFLAHFLLKGEGLGVLKLSGVALALLGLVLVFSQRLGGGALRGDLFVLGSAIFWTLQTICVKRYLSRENPFLIAAWQSMASFPLILVLGLFLGEPYRLELSLPVVLAILYSGPIVVGFAVVLWVRLLQDYPATSLSSFLFLTPVFGVLIGYLVLGDPLGGAMIIGVALVCCGIYLVNRPAATKGS